LELFNNVTGVRFFETRLTSAEAKRPTAWVSRFFCQLD